VRNLRSEEEIKAKLEKLKKEEEALFKPFYPDGDPAWNRLNKVKAYIRALLWVLGLTEDL